MTGHVGAGSVIEVYGCHTCSRSKASRSGRRKASEVIALAVYERRRARRPARPAYVPRTDLRRPARPRAVNVWGVTDILGAPARRFSTVERVCRTTRPGRGPAGTPDDGSPSARARAVRMAHCGPRDRGRGDHQPEDRGGCPEDCHFCSQSGQFTSPVRSVWLDIPQAVKAAEETAATGATEFCIVAAVRGPDDRLMAQVVTASGHPGGRRHQRRLLARHAHPGAGRRPQGDGVHRYNHNLEAAKSYFPSVVTTPPYEERWDTCEMVRESGMEACCGGLVGMGETLEQRAELASQAAEAGPHGAAEP